VPKATIIPSLTLWAEDNDISSEALAEAYGLGIKDTSIIKDVSSVRPNEGRAPNVELGKYLAIDCEMVGVGVGDGGTDGARRIALLACWPPACEP